MIKGSILAWRLMGLGSTFLVAAPPSSQGPVRIEIQRVEALSFGKLLVGPTGGGGVLTPEGAWMGNGASHQRGALPKPAQFRLSGPPRQAFRLYLEPTLRLVGPRGELRVREFNASLPGLRGVFDANGQAICKLGARLEIQAMALAGTYRSLETPLRMEVLDESGRVMGSTSLPFDMEATLIAPLVLKTLGDLDFGDVVPGRTVGIVEVHPGGGYDLSRSGGARLLQGGVRPATFDLQGQAGTAYSIRLPQSCLLTGPGEAIKVEQFTTNVPINGVLKTNGLQFGVGAQLLVRPSQIPGNYSGYFTVSVDYL